MTNTISAGEMNFLIHSAGWRKISKGIKIRILASSWFWPGRFPGAFVHTASPDYLGELHRFEGKSFSSSYWLYKPPETVSGILQHGDLEFIDLNLITAKCLGWLPGFRISTDRPMHLVTDSDCFGEH